MLEKISVDSLRNRLHRHNSPVVHNPFPEGFFPGPAQPAAVLLPLTRARERWNLLFIRRTEGEHDRHSGQVAFPGGRADDGDLSPEATALRETEEEIGIPPGEVNILGRLDAFYTISNYIVTPVIGLIDWPMPLMLAPTEVARAFLIPFHWLADPENYRIAERTLPGQNIALQVIHYRFFSGEILWGISAQIVVSFIQLLLDPPRRE